MPIRIKFNQWDCLLLRSSVYGNGRTALVLIDYHDKEPVAVATVNLPHVPLAKDEVIIKDYSENEGMLQALVDAGIVKPTGRMVVSGFVAMEVCKLLKKELIQE